MKVLVIDDEPAMLEGIANRLTAHGLAVSACTNGAQAIDVLSGDNSIDAVVSDVVMEGLVGTALLDAIHEARPDLPVIFMSSMPENRVRAAVPGDYKFIRKPFDVTTLVDLIDRVTDPLQRHLLATLAPGRGSAGRSQAG